MHTENVTVVKHCSLNVDNNDELNIRNAFVGAQSSPLNFTVPRKDAHASLLQQKGLHASKTHMNCSFT